LKGVLFATLFSYRGWRHLVERKRFSMFCLARESWGVRQWQRVLFHPVRAQLTLDQIIELIDNYPINK